MSSNFNSKINSFFSIFLNKNFHYSLIALGISLRLKHFFEFRSLWLDEAYVANMISAQSYMDFVRFKLFSADLALPPSLFLFLEKLSTDLFGNYDYTLRLLPLICGIFSLIIFYKIIKDKLSPHAVPIALALFALAEPLVYYASELKPYSSDVFSCLLLLYLADYCQSHPLSKSKKAILAIVGSFTILFSYPAIFVLACIMIYLIVMAFLKKDFYKAQDFVKIGFIQASVFLYYYVFFLRNMTRNDHLLDPVIGLGYLSKAPLFSIEKFEWLTAAFIRIFNETAGLIVPELWAIIFLFGFWAFYRKSASTAFLLISPLLLAIFAAIINKFPFGDRYLLFLCPILFIFVSEGIVISFRKMSKFSFPLALIVIAVLFYNPVKDSGYYVTHGRDKEQLRPLMNILKNNLRNEDAINLNTSATFGYFYYLSSLDYPIRKSNYGVINDVWHFDPVESAYIMYNKVVFNKDGWWRGYSSAPNPNSVFQFDSDSWPNAKNNPRTWILLNHARPHLKELILTSLNNSGELLEKHEREGASLYLYDLSKN